MEIERRKKRGRKKTLAICVEQMQQHLTLGHGGGGRIDAVVPNTMRGSTLGDDDEIFTLN